MIDSPIDRRILIILSDFFTDLIPCVKLVQVLDIEVTYNSGMLTAETASPLSYRRIINTWWPLAASWLLMGVELPILSAVMARLLNPAINLAAYGGIVFPLAD